MPEQRTREVGRFTLTDQFDRQHVAITTELLTRGEKHSESQHPPWIPGPLTTYLEESGTELRRVGPGKYQTEDGLPLELTCKPEDEPKED